MKWLREHLFVSVLIAIIVLRIGYINVANAQKRNLSDARLATQRQQANTPPPCTVDAERLTNYINNERATVGAPKLAVDATLVQSSKIKADEMIANSYYGHDRLDGTSWSTIPRSLGINATVSEDIGSSDNNPDQSFQEFRASKPHYDSLVNAKYTRVGITAICTNFKLQKATGPNDNSVMVGQTITDITVIHLAEPEPTPGGRAASPAYNATAQPVFTNYVPKPTAYSTSVPVPTIDYASCYSSKEQSAKTYYDAQVAKEEARHNSVVAYLNSITGGRSVDIEAAMIAETNTYKQRSEALRIAYRQALAAITC